MEYNTPFDDVFRTLLEKCSNLIIPVINEVFGTDYALNDQVTLLANEQFFEGEDGEQEKRITDCRIMIKEHTYHIECQSRPDSTIAIRMMEYDFHIALAQKEEKEGEQILRFPESAVLYLRHTKNTPEKLYVKIIFPDVPEVRHGIPVVKMQEYTKEDILDKQLFFFTPYYILKFEKELERINADEEKVKKLTADYQEIYEGLKILEKQKMIDGTYLYNLVVLTERLIRVVADGQSNIKREVNIMGGRVLELESDKILQRGREEGKEEGMLIAAYNLEILGYNETTVCDMIGVELENYKKYKAEKKLKPEEVQIKKQGKKR